MSNPPIPVFKPTGNPLVESRWARLARRDYVYPPLQFTPRRSLIKASNIVVTIAAKEVA